MPDNPGSGSGEHTVHSVIQQRLSYVRSEFSCGSQSVLDGHRTSFSFDRLSRQVARQDEMGFVATTVFDSRGLAVAQVDPLGKLVTSVYDNLSRPQARIAPDGFAVTNVYDNVGNPIARVNELGYRTTQVFDGRNRLVNRIDPLGRVLTMHYNLAYNMDWKQDARQRRSGVQ